MADGGCSVALRKVMGTGGRKEHVMANVEKQESGQRTAKKEGCNRKRGGKEQKRGKGEWSINERERTSGKEDWLAHVKWCERVSP